jgi:hypothetical protein
VLPIRYAVESAPTQAQVLERLSSFLEYLRSCHVDMVLPPELAGLSACSTDSVRDWAALLEENWKDDYRLSAAGQCWMEEVREAFVAAANRLDRIAAGEGPAAQSDEPARQEETRVAAGRH